MKTNIIKFFSLILLVFYTNNIFASSECSINDSPDYINQFIKNIKKVNNNVNKIANSKAKEHTPNIIEDYIGYLNQLFNWTTQKVDFIYVKGQENFIKPQQVKRDIKRLDKLQKQIDLKNKYGTNVLLTYDEICKGIDEKTCNFEFYEKYRAGKVIYLLKESINSLKASIQNNVSEEKLISQTKKIYLFPKEDIKKLTKDYSNKNIKICSIVENNKGEKGFFGKILDAFKNINFIKGKNNDAFEPWREAIRLLHGSSGEHKKQEIQSKNIKQSLKNNGIGADYSENKIKNFKEYGRDSEVIGQASFLNSIITVHDNFNATLKKIFPEMNSKELSKKNIPHKEPAIKIIKEYNNTIKDKDVLININSEYKKLKDLSMQEDIENDSFIDRLIEMHINLSQATNVATKTCKISKKVCNSQLTGVGDCGECY